MRFATLPNGSPTGGFTLVSRDNRACPCRPRPQETLQQALDRWVDVVDALEEEYAALNASTRARRTRRRSLPAPPPPPPRGAAWRPCPAPGSGLDGSAY